MTQYAELIARLEAATGPDREVDAMIHVTSGNVSPGHTDVTSCVGCGCAPMYSKSIDAALTLVPEGWVVDIRTGDPTFNHAPARRPSTLIQPFNGNDEGWKSFDLRNQISQGATLAISLCIAALKARSAS